MSRFKKMLLGAVTGLVLATGVVISPASASVPTQGRLQIDGNAPTLAWRGEHVRLGFCPPAGSPLSTADQVTWSIEDWSGDPANGTLAVPFEITGARHFSNGCVYSEFSSQKAGLAFIKLSINAGSDAEDPGAPLVTKQYMVAWMELQTPTVTGGGTVSAADFNCGYGLMNTMRIGLQDPYRACAPVEAVQPLSAATAVVDPPTPVVPADPTHLITANVKGIIPLLANFSNWGGLGNHLTMPDDWAKWAAVAARSSGYSSNVYPVDHSLAQAMTNWDLHDGVATSADTHVIGTCDDAVNLAGTTDTVDNCAVTPADSLVPAAAFGGTEGPFSTVFGDRSTDQAIGPYDMLYTNDTLLSDGIIDAGDAPMPAAQIDVDIKENTGAPTDISGVGYLSPSWKYIDDSRDGLGTDAAHNYDQPFYSQYIPATDRPVSGTGSPYGAVQPTGITGTKGTAFGGFWWTGSDAYRNWQFAYETSYHPNADSHCLDYRSLPGDYLHYRPLPYGYSSVTIYTDEHGNANVRYVPSLGMYFDNLGALKNIDGGCDLEGIQKIGSADVGVTARYPYQPVISDPAPAAVHYDVNSLFHKTLAAYAKGPGPQNANVQVVLAHAQDIDGNPLSHEVVCWSQQGAGYIHPFPTSSAGGTILDSHGKTVAVIDANQAKHGYFLDPYSGRQCTTTDDNGNTAVEVGNSEGGVVDVMSEWMNEIIFRDIKIDFTPAAGSLGNLANETPAANVPTPALIKAATAAGGTVSVGPVLVDGAKVTVKTKVVKSASKATKKVAHQIRLARVIKPFGGKRVLQVRVNGIKGMVALRITIKLGKTTHTYKRFVLANQKVAVKNLPIPAKTAKVTVSLVG